MPGECPCYENIDPPAGAYRLVVDVYRAFTCYEDTCLAPVESGLLSDRMVSGEAISVETAFFVPWDGGPLMVEIEP